MPLNTTTGFPRASKLVEKKWEERRMRLHAQRVHEVQPLVNTAPPKVYPHMVLRLKKIQSEEVKQAEIDRDNQILLQRMTWILKRKGKIDNWNDYRQMSMNKMVREREQQEIAEKNLSIAKKLDSVKPYYNAQEWEEEYERKALLQNQWKHSTKEFDQSTPRSSMASRRANSYEHLPPLDKKDSRRGSQKAKSDTSGSTVTKLPKIHNNGNTKDAIADQDAKLLFRAVKNLTKPEEVVIKTLIRRSPKQRMLTKEKFEQSYEMNLGPELKKVLGSPYFTLIDCLLGLKNKRDTSDIHSALKARDIAKLVEIFTSRGPSALSASAATYKKDYDVSLEQDLKERIPEEDCQNLLLALLSDRPVTEAVNEDLAARDAEELREAGEGRFNNENGKFILLIKQRSLAQLRATLNAYGQLSGGNDISELLEEDGCSRNFVTGVEALDESSKLGSGQWAEQIHGQLKPNNAELISTMLDRNDQEMTSIRKAYRKKFSAELTDDIMVKCGKEVGPLIAHIAARGGVTPAPGATRQPRPPPVEKPKRVNGMTVPSPPKKPPLKVFSPRTPEFGKDNPFQEPQRRPIGDHIRQDAKEKLDKKPPAKGNKTDRDAKKKSPAKVGGKGSKGYAADDDVKRVREAMKGWGTDEEPLIQILAGRTNEQRQQIRKKYQEKYKSDLLEDLKAELSGDLEEAVVALMMGPGEYDAYCLHDAISGPGTCEAVLIGILTTRSAKEMKAISGKYEELYEETLAEAVEGDTSDGFGELLGRLVRGERDQSNSVDQKLVTQDAEDLYQDGDEHLSSQNETFKDVMTKRNISHSQAVFEKYKKLSGHSIEEAIEDSFAGDLQDGYIGLAQAIQSTADFYAQRLHNAMSGMGTNDKTLIRILVSRSEVDLADIKNRYKALYKKSLDDAVDSECSGDYKKLLLALIKDK